MYKGNWGHASKRENLEKHIVGSTGGILALTTVV